MYSCLHALYFTFQFFLFAALVFLTHSARFSVSSGTICFVEECAFKYQCFTKMFSHVWIIADNATASKMHAVCMY